MCVCVCVCVRERERERAGAYLQEAVKREVKEESGLDFEPETLLCVECHAHSWVRFTLGGRIVGGALKTVAEADKESLQAQWQPMDQRELLHSVSRRADVSLSLSLSLSRERESLYTPLELRGMCFYTQ